MFFECRPLELCRPLRKLLLTACCFCNHESLSQVVFLAICMCCMSKREKVAFFLDENVFVRVTMFALTWWRINKLIKEWQAYHSATCLFFCFYFFTFIVEIYIQGITAFQHFVRWPLSWILSLWALVHWRDYIINKTPPKAYPWNAQTVNTKYPLTVNFKYR